MKSRAFDLLVVDADSEFRRVVAQIFGNRGVTIHEAATADAAMSELNRRRFDSALVDMATPGVTGLEILKQIRDASPDCEVVLLTGQGTVEAAVEAIKAGAGDFLTKPFPSAELEVLVERAFERSKLAKQNAQLKAALERSQSSSDIIGSSPAMQDAFRIIERAGTSDDCVLIEGESGTGKELAARAVHRASCRTSQPFVTLHCAAMPETLLESELFGHEKGAFTGAVSSKLGLLEIADGGTILIEDIGQLPSALQTKLLRVLETGCMCRVGSDRQRRVDVRVLASTGCDLQTQVRAGAFCGDLLRRISAISLTLPPLRERVGDVRFIVLKFFGPEWSVSSDVMRALETYSWPGNVRQLLNVLERAKFVAEGKMVSLSDLPAEVVGRAANTRAADRNFAMSTELSAGPAGDALAAVQRTHIVEILRRERGNKARSARALGINRRSLYRLLEKHRIDPTEAMGEAPRVPIS